MTVRPQVREGAVFLRAQAPYRPVTGPRPSAASHGARWAAPRHGFVPRPFWSGQRQRPRSVRKLHTAHAFACWMQVEDSRHEVPPPDAFGHLSYRRPRVRDIRRLLEAAIGLPFAGTITPLT